LPLALGTSAAHAAEALHPDRSELPGAAPVPTSAMTMPTGIEDLSPYMPQVSCDPHVKPGVKAF
jgi:hypothetical protein